MQNEKRLAGKFVSKGAKKFVVYRSATDEICCRSWLPKYYIYLFLPNDEDNFKCRREKIKQKGLNEKKKNLGALTALM